MSEIKSMSCYPHLLRASSFEELVETPMHGKYNVILMERVLPIDFQPLTDKLAAQLITHHPNSFYSLKPEEIEPVLFSIAPEEEEAIRFILHDIANLPKGILRLQVTNRTDMEGEFHLDGPYPATFTDRIMCVYAGSTTEGIDADDVEQHRRVEYKRTARLNSQTYYMPLGGMWKHACIPHKKAEPFVHKSPSPYRVIPEHKNRLLLAMDIRS